MALKFDVDILLSLVSVLIGFVIGYMEGKNNRKPWYYIIMLTVLFVILSLLFGSRIL